MTARSSTSEAFLNPTQGEKRSSDPGPDDDMGNESLAAIQALGLLEGHCHVDRYH